MSEQQQNENNKRMNYSRYGRLCDQNFYHDSQPSNKSPQNYQGSPGRISIKDKNTVSFTSVPRQKRGNYRFAIRLPYGEFSHHPHYKSIKPKSPQWSFSKQQRYSNQKHQDFQVCPKNHMFKQKKQLYDHAESVQSIYKDKVRLLKSSSFMSTTQRSLGLNYSILGPRDTSPVGFFNRTKISQPFYITKEKLLQVQEEFEKAVQHKKQPCPKGYIEFYKKKGRQANRNVKKFQTFLQTYKHQKQYSNFELTQHPTKPCYHINFSKILQRPPLHGQFRYGPNPEVPSINITRINKNRIDFNLNKFRSKIKTRYDRVQPQPNVRLDYDIPPPDLGGMVTMDKTLPRNQELFPIIDPIIKKAGDNEMKQNLKKSITTKQINQALRPKCNQPCLQQ